jgi:alpha-L-fucosidase 2
MRPSIASLAIVLLAAAISAAQPAPLSLEAPITRWDDGLPLGNGLIGALVWGEGGTVRISLDRADLWDLRTPEMLQRPDWTWETMKRLKAAGDHAKHVEMFDVPYDTIPYPTKLPGGRLELTFETARATGFTLDLARAEARVSLGETVLSAFIADEAPVLLLNITGEAPTVRIVPASGVSALGYPGATVTTSEQGGISWMWSIQPTVAGQAFAVVVGSVRTERGLLAAATITAAGPTGESDDGAPSGLPKARASIREALREGYKKTLEGHIVRQRGFWKTSSVTIPDEGLQRQYDFVKYLYSAGSRPGAPPMPLQGVWTADEGGLPPWKGDYHNDLNTQMTYLAYLDAGLFDAGRAFIEFNWGLRERYQRFAREFYGLERGLVVPGVMTLDGSPMGGWGQYSLSPTHTAWIAQSFYLHWRYTMDRGFLQGRAYPWCTDAARALLALMERGDDGLLRLPLSSSPEIYDNSFKEWMPPNSNYDLALMRALFGWCAEMAAALGLAEDAQAWGAALDGLGPLDLDPESGALTFARGFPYNESHRHFSHSMAIHPLGLMTVEGPDEDLAAVTNTLNQIEKMGTGAWCGYSFSWFSAMAARAGQAERALEYLKKYERGFIGRNGFHLNGDQSGTGLSGFTYRPFTLEGNFLAMQAVQEMLLQSWGGVVRVFPAVSERWGEVSFEGLRAEGGWKVSAQRRGGRTVFVRIESMAGGVLRLRDPFSAREVDWGRGGVRRDGRDWVVELLPGEELEGRAE